MTHHPIRISCTKAYKRLLGSEHWGERLDYVGEIVVQGLRLGVCVVLMRSDFKYCKQMGRVKALPIVTSIIFIAALNFLLQIGHEQSYLRNLLTGLGYIGDDMECGIHHVGQLYRDSFINSPIVLETFGLVSGFGFEGYTWKQHNNGFVQLSALYLKDRSALNETNTQLGRVIYLITHPSPSPPLRQDE